MLCIFEAQFRQTKFAGINFKTTLTFAIYFSNYFAEFQLFFNFEKKQQNICYLFFYVI